MDVVKRIRWALVSIVVLLVLAALVGGYQLFQVKASQRLSGEHYLPALVQSQQLQSGLARFHSISGQLTALTTADEVIEAKNALDEVVLELERISVDTARTSISMDEHVRLADGLENLQKFADQMLPLRLTGIELTSSMARHRIDLTNVREAIRDTAEPELLDVLSMLERAVTRAAMSRPVMRSDWTDPVSSLVNRQLDLSEFLLRISALVDVAEQVSMQRDANAISGLRSQLHFELRGITQLLASFSDGPIRRQLAAKLTELNSLVFGKAGVASELAAYSEQQTAFEDAYAAQIDVSSDLSTMIDALVVRTRADNAQSLANVQTALKRVTIITLFSLIAALGLIAAINFFIVEKQINRRMTALTSAVLDIADGNIEQRVGITGRDELGRMARSLDVFKSNARELKRSNNEMEQFAYAASHDMRSPLRAIENLAQWTIEDGGESLPDVCKDHLNKLMDRAKRLSALQNDLLDYSRAGSGDHNLGDFNLAAQIAELTEMLDAEHRFAVVVEGDSVSGATYLTPLRQVLMNLISNAIKHHDLEQGRIAISAERKGERWMFTVHDDGPGIAPEYHEKIFGLFQTLQSRDTVEGSGLGLSLVSRLVSRYEGVISVDSNPAVARGTVFRFDWPVFS